MSSVHMSLANSHWKNLEKNREVIIIFDGPHGYISPLYYENPRKLVPTWNYTTFIMKGEASIIKDNDWLLNSVNELTDKYEIQSQWKDEVDKEIINHLSKGIVGIRIKIISTEAKFKISQNKSESENQNIVNGINEFNPSLANMMKKYSI